MSDHYREVRSLRQQAQKAEKATVNIEDYLEPAFARCKLLDEVAESQATVLSQLLDSVFQNFSRDLS